MSVYKEMDPLSEEPEENQSQNIVPAEPAGPVEVLEVSKLVPEELAQISESIDIVNRNGVIKVLNDIFTGTERWQKQIDDIVLDEFGVKMADVARKQIKSVRLDAEKIFDSKRAEVKRLKASFDLEDALWLKSKQIMQLKFKHLETQAEEKATHFERIEKERLENLFIERKESIDKYEHTYSDAVVRALTDEDFNDVLLLLYEKEQDKINAEIARKKKEEDDRLNRIEQQRQQAEKQRLLDEENKRLRDEQIEKDRLHTEELNRQREVQALKDKEQEAERQRLIEASKENERKLKAQADADNAEIARQKKIAEDAEREKQRLIDAEKKRIADAEALAQKAIDDAKAEAERVTKLSHDEKVLEWIESFPKALPATELLGSTVYGIQTKYKFFIDWARKEAVK